MPWNEQDVERKFPWRNGTPAGWKIKTAGGLKGLAKGTKFGPGLPRGIINNHHESKHSSSAPTHWSVQRYNHASDKDSG